MKNKNFIIFFLLLFTKNIQAENLNIQAKNISLDKDGMTSIFKDDVIIKLKEKIIKSNYAKYNKKTGNILIQENIVAEDDKGNIIEAEIAEYYDNKKILKTKGITKIVTSDKYVLEGSDIFINNDKKLISSERDSILTDLDGNKIFLENFEYQVGNNIFKSIGLVKIIDNKKNNLEFAQIYIDTKTNEFLGSDIKAFFNDENFKINKKNKPRIFSNSFSSNNQQSTFIKSIFTLCDYRDNDKCPPWSIQSTKMLHDNKKKTIYYDNAIIKVYDIPIFFIPKFSHPDPTVARRSGFLPPAISDTKNLGESITVPYFFNISKDKNFTLNSRLFVSENPLFTGEYHQALKNSFVMADFGYTEGYKKTSSTKKKGEKSHFFGKYSKSFIGKNNSDNNLNISIQDTSNDKYLKLYKIKSNLVNYNNDVLENSMNYTYQKDDIFFGLEASVFETTKNSYEDKYEYILPEISFDKDLFNDEKLGSLDFQSNFKVRNYDTNKLESFFVNNFNWEKDYNLLPNINTRFLSNVKNINYETKNVSIYKNETTSELFGALGLLSEINLKKTNNNKEHFLDPKIFLRLSPGSMRDQSGGSRLTPLNAFNIDRIDDKNNFETGISSTFGFDYKIRENNQTKFDLSLAQIVNKKENNKMADKTSLNEKLSDLVGTSNYKINDNLKLKYNFSIDQNYKDINYSEVASSYNFKSINFDFGYLNEKKHIGDQKYFTTKIDYKTTNNALLSYETKRNLVTNSSEFYNLSYEYFNDCLKAGLVYRREFYNDSELEPENSLMFKITLIPFGSIDSPTLSN